VTPRRWAFDISLAAVLVVLGQVEAWSGALATHRQGPVAAEAALYAVTTGLLVIRRVDPLGCLALIVVVSAVEFAIFGSPEGFGIAMPGLVASYTVGRWETRRPAWWGLVLDVLLWLAWSGFDPMDTSLRLHAQSALWLSPWVIAWLVGALVRSQAQNLEQRRAARQQRDARAVAEERNRIARELHDVIGHSVSVMTVQASAVRRRLTPEQEQEREALTTVESVGREALAEMRRMVGVLRADGAATGREPPPGLSQVDRLVDKVRASGLMVDVYVTGAARPLPGGLDLTAYRLIQEGLTNTIRHAALPRSVEVQIFYGPDCVEIAVRDDGGPVPADVQPGQGLLGMRERVSVYGGQLVARPRTEGGFELVASLPWEQP
jgi:signal transduction histidine kinase